MTTENSLKILTECHADLAERLSACIGMALDDADDVLFNMVKNTGSPEHTLYFEALREIRRKRNLIESGFREKYINNYKNRIEVEKSRKISESEPNTATGSILENSIKNIDEALAVTSTVSRIRRICEPVLSAVDKHMEDLKTDALRLNKELYPASPEIICTAFQEACEVIETKVEVKLILLKEFEKVITDKMEEIYVDLDGLMTEKMKSVRAKTVAKDMDNEQSLKSTLPSGRQDDHFIQASGEVRKQINLHLGKAKVPDFINDLLFNHWSKLLLKIYLRGGLESNNWLKAIEVVDDLVTCVGSQSSLSVKKEFSPKIKYLVQRLRNGMNAIGVSPAIQTDLVTRLFEYHKELIKPETKTEAFDEAVTVPGFTQESKSVPFFNELLMDKK